VTMKEDRITGHLFAAEDARNDAIERVVKNAGHDFTAQVWAVIRAMPIGTLFTGEDLRHQCEALGIYPHHHNAWGGVMARFDCSPLIKKTGRRIKMQDVKSHARKTDEYIRIA